MPCNGIVMHSEQQHQCANRPRSRGSRCCYCCCCCCFCCCTARTYVYLFDAQNFLDVLLGLDPVLDGREEPVEALFANLDVGSEAALGALRHALHGFDRDANVAGQFPKVLQCLLSAGSAAGRTGAHDHGRSLLQGKQQRAPATGTGAAAARSLRLLQGRCECSSRVDDDQGRGDKKQSGNDFWHVAKIDWSTEFFRIVNRYCR
mmetsp:Transcript_14858/g.41368  ORF Transcript_14858/g.41368 Transcript_14858/m.41368 type:complete len:204 (-) Transcript_14858:58-669(-)